MFSSNHKAVLLKGFEINKLCSRFFLLTQRKEAKKYLSMPAMKVGFCHTALLCIAI